MCSVCLRARAPPRAALAHAAVPFEVDAEMCNLTLADPCLADAYRNSMVTAMYLTWDGGDNVTVVEDIKVPVLGVRRYVWDERRESV